MSDLWQKEKAAGSLRVDGKTLKYGEITYEIIYVNSALLKTGVPKNMGAHPIEGNCLAPQVLNGDMLVVAYDAQPRDGDIVLAVKEGFRFASRYRDNGTKKWLESAHGKQSLEGCSIVAVAVFVGRPERIPYVTPAGELVMLPIVGTVKA